MQSRLKDKKIIVIGSATGIGAATVRRLVSEGAKVALADINIEGAEKFAAELAGEGHTAFAINMDITDENAVNQGVEAAVKRLGGLDGAHINAADLKAIFDDSNVLDVSLATFDRTLSVNLRGHFLATRAVLPHLREKGGAIVYTGSSASDSGGPERPAYATAKSGLNALMRHVACRYGPEGVSANVVAPGFVITAEMEAYGLQEGFLEYAQSQTPSFRLGTSEDIAASVAMLLSEDGRWVNGQVFHVNGGALLR